MGKCSKRGVALIAELLADKLIRTYRDEQLSAMVESFALAGFTQTALKQDPVKLFQMLVTAAYDRRPFTLAARGSEVIWGVHYKAQSIPQALKALSLFTPTEVRRQDEDAIHRQLDSQTYFGCSLATDDALVRFARTLLDLTRLTDSGFHGQILSACSAKDVQAIYSTLTGVHGIGDTIGAKLVKYLLREIGVGKVLPGDFPLTVVWPITDEYHASNAIASLSYQLDSTLAPLTLGVLLGRGEPFAIDALFYLQRQRRRELDEFIEEAQTIRVGGSPTAEPPRQPRTQERDVELARKLFAVIKEIYDSSRGVTQAEIRRADLQDLLTPARIRESGRWLYMEMEKLAADGNASEMVAFYQNCLHSEKGKLIGWGLQQLGRTSMESEADRFMAIYEGRASRGGESD